MSRGAPPETSSPSPNRLPSDTDRSGVMRAAERLEGAGGEARRRRLAAGPVTARLVTGRSFTQGARE